MRFNLGERLRKIFTNAAADTRFDDLEDLLVEADVGAAVAAQLVSQVRRMNGERRSSGNGDIVALLKEILLPSLHPAVLPITPGSLTVGLVCGVNGVGKTTTIAKLAAHLRDRGQAAHMLFCAADTFRAAAGEQLALWGERLGIKVIRQAQGADPGAVVFDSLESARTHAADLLLIDTSGRMHTKEHLVKELAKIDKIVTNRLPAGGTYHKLLVIDATTGQNAPRQAQAFHQAIGINSVILAKFDSSAKGGAVVTIGRELNLPFSFVGTGEALTDIGPFNPDAFLAALFGDQ